MGHAYCQLRSRFAVLLSIVAVLLNASFCMGRPTPKAIVPATEIAKLQTYLKNSQNFKNILALLQRKGTKSGTLTGLQNLQLFISAGPVTLFLPTDTAYAKLDSATKSKLATGDFAWLQGVLQFQVVLTRQTFKQLSALKRGATMSTKYKQQTIQKASDGSTITLNPIGQKSLSKVFLKDAYMPSSMAVHGVDTFLFPKV